MNIISSSFNDLVITVTIYLYFDRFNEANMAVVRHVWMTTTLERSKGLMWFSNLLLNDTDLLFKPSSADSIVKDIVHIYPAILEKLNADYNHPEISTIPNN